MSGVGEKPVLELPAGAEGKPVVILANDWFTDPTSKHHVGRALSDVTDVVWVEASGMRRPDMTNVADLKRIWTKLTGGGQAPARREPPPVEVVSPLSLPLPGFRPAEWLNARTYRRRIGEALERIGASELPLLWVYVPTTEPYLDRIPHDGLIYHCVDRWWEFSEYDEKVMRRHHERLCRSADVVFASAAELVKDCEAFTEDVHLIRHGVDWDHFSRAALEELPVPEEIADVEGQVIGFFGLIHDWIDVGLIGRVADAYPEATVILIGEARVDVSALEARPNVRLLGRKPYAELPGYSARFDVALIPFVINELTAAVNPIKLREYLSAGLPVAATALPEIMIYDDEPSVHVAHDADDFIASVGSFLAGAGDRAAREELARSMFTESWQGRTAEMVRLWVESRD